VAVANDPSAANLTDYPILVESSLSLANGGEAVRIERNATVVHERRYRDAPEGESDLERHPDPLAAGRRDR